MAMARGTVDGSATGVVSMYTRKYHEVQKYATLMNLNFTGIPMLINLKFWKSLPNDLQQIIQKSATESAVFVKKESQRMVDESIAGLKERDMKVYKLSPKERKAFKKAALPVTKRWIKRHGDTGKELIEYVEKSK